MLKNFVTPVFPSWNSIFLAVVSFNEIRRSEGKAEIITQDYINFGEWLPGFRFKLHKINPEIDEAWLKFCQESEYKYGIQFLTKN